LAAPSEVALRFAVNDFTERHRLLRVEVLGEKLLNSLDRRRLIGTASAFAELVSDEGVTATSLIFNRQPAGTTAARRAATTRMMQRSISDSLPRRDRWYRIAMTK
jgi:hypothetical protein